MSLNLNSIFTVVIGSWWLVDKYFRKQETERVGILATGNTVEFPIHFFYCPASLSDKTLILFGLSCHTTPAVRTEWGACTVAAWCRWCEGLGKTFGYDLPVPWQLQAHSEQPGAERCQELREPQESRRVISGTGKKEKGSDEERSELKNQSRRAKGKAEGVQQREAGGRLGPELVEISGEGSRAALALQSLSHAAAAARAAERLPAPRPLPGHVTEARASGTPVLMH